MAIVLRAERYAIGKKRAQRMKILLAAAVLILAAVMVVPVPLRINHTLPGIRWESDGGLPEECEVTLEGWYYCYLTNLIRNNVYKGDITLSTAGETRTYLAPRVVLYRHPMYGSSVRAGTLTVYDPEENQMRPMGNLAVPGGISGIKELFIQGEKWNFSAPAVTPAEAEALADELAYPGF